MTHKKQRKKAVRRAKKLAERAWEAVEAEDFGAARTWMTRALREHQGNADLWKDLAAISKLTGDSEEAEAALERAIVLAPSDVEAFLDLAELLASRGRSQRAAQLIEQARELRPDNAEAQVLAPDPHHVREEADVDIAPVAEARSVFALDRYDWNVVREELTRSGLCLLPKLLDRECCEAMIGLFERESSFEKSVRLAGPHGRGGEYKFFRPPLPLSLDLLRAGVYEELHEVANEWNERLGVEARWPRAHARFLRECASQGQRRSTPILLRYQSPAFNELHQDVWGECYFPIQLTVTLSPRAAPGHERPGFEGGELVIQDMGAGRKLRRHEVATSEGDAVLFCTRERLVPIGGRYGLQAVAHGMAPLTRGERYALGLPFHNYKGDGG